MGVSFVYVMKSTDSNPLFPDSMYTDQAAYLAEHTPLTAKEAEAYLRRAHSTYDDNGEVFDRTLAKEMGVSKSTFSIHLNNAMEKLDSEAAVENALTTLLLTTDIGGGAGSHNRRVIASQKTLNAFVLITETEFYDAEEYNFPSKYKAHFVYPDYDDDAIDFDALPDDIIHYDKHSLFTVKSSDKDHFVKSIAAYVNALDALEPHDLLKTLTVLDDHGFDTDEYSNSTVQEIA